MTPNLRLRSNLTPVITYGFVGILIAIVVFYFNIKGELSKTLEKRVDNKIDEAKFQLLYSEQPNLWKELNTLKEKADSLKEKLDSLSQITELSLQPHDDSKTGITPDFRHELLEYDIEVRDIKDRILDLELKYASSTVSRMHDVADSVKSLYLLTNKIESDITSISGVPTVSILIPFHLRESDLLKRRLSSSYNAEIDESHRRSPDEGKYRAIRIDPRVKWRDVVLIVAKAREVAPYLDYVFVRERELNDTTDVYLGFSKNGIDNYRPFSTSEFDTLFSRDWGEDNVEFHKSLLHSK